MSVQIQDLMGRDLVDRDLMGRDLVDRDLMGRDLVDRDLLGRYMFMGLFNGLYSVSP
jgi:hypothetical protein